MFDEEQVRHGELQVMHSPLLVRLLFPEQVRQKVELRQDLQLDPQALHPEDVETTYPEAQVTQPVPLVQD
jgi:hypothetical protein